MDQAERIVAYFLACSEGSATEIAAHFTPDAVIYDTNISPARGAERIGRMWVKVRERWGGARWTVDSMIAPAEDRSVASIEWSMTGHDLDGSVDGDVGVDRDVGGDLDGATPFIFRGSEHYRFEDTLISEIRQYWTFDPDRLDTHLIDYGYDHHHNNSDHNDTDHDDSDGR